MVEEGDFLNVRTHLGGCDVSNLGRIAVELSAKPMLTSNCESELSCDHESHACTDEPFVAVTDFLWD
jgi:hypothetical protein